MFFFSFFFFVREVDQTLAANSGREMVERVQPWDDIYIRWWHFLAQIVVFACATAHAVVSALVALSRRLSRGRFYLLDWAEKELSETNPREWAERWDHENRLVLVVLLVRCGKTWKMSSNEKLTQSVYKIAEEKQRSSRLFWPLREIGWHQASKGIFFIHRFHMRVKHHQTWSVQKHKERSRN